MNYALLTLSVTAAGALAANRMVNQAGAYPAAGGLAFGATRSAAALGDPTPVDVLGTATVTAGDAFPKDARLMVGADGKVVEHDAAADSCAIGRALEAATAANQEVEILLIPHPGL